MKKPRKNIKKNMKTNMKNARFSRGPDFHQNTHIPEEKAPLHGSTTHEKRAVLVTAFFDFSSKSLKKNPQNTNPHAIAHYRKIHVFLRFFNDFKK